MSTITNSSLIWDLFKALGLDYKYVTDVTIHIHADDMVRVDVTHLLEEDSGKAMVEVMKHYYLIERPDGTDKTDKES